MEIMQHNKLTAASLRILGAFKKKNPNKEIFRHPMQMDPLPGSVGFETAYIEYFAVVYTFAAYEALWDFFCPHINPFGYGFDYWYYFYAQHPEIQGKLPI